MGTNKPLLLAVFLAFAASACASAPQPRPAATADTNTSATAAAKTTAVGCVNSTGSRITRKESECQAGRTYTKDDIDRTGATSVGEALRRLDPAVGGGR